VTAINTVEAIYLGDLEVEAVYLGGDLIWPDPVGLLLFLLALGGS
jgi:hypothetical protein